ncbi:MurR/RpiR family transcriptional regulator [Petroclostridium sp. X23]|uniref:MurR/RpiR family transcriptional regulator n=1 Tax=Petroclostridium sp. X23 TaxID=3045146 RepID=UPI0024AE0A9E|nr:MurR/RpiR family transcriptional regulator [Petroclostridium sp. X23]WHH58755.1 MurR/RpiR family transcriptional regulator [Petroclostridium sp. X23]
MKSNILNIDINKLSKSQKKIADFILKNKARLPYLTIDEIAGELNISTATISRFCKYLGFDNFKEFKSHLRKDMNITPASKIKTTLSKAHNDDLCMKLISQQIDNLHNTIQNLSLEEFDKAINALVKANKVYIFAPGPSQSLAYILKYRLDRFGLDLIIMEKSGSDIYESLVHVDKDDVIIVFGFVKMLVETHVVLDYSKSIGCTTILITDLMVSEMVDAANIILYTCRGEIYEFHSMVSPMALMDCIIVGIALKMESSALNLMDKLIDIRKTYSSYLPR